MMPMGQAGVRGKADGSGYGEHLLVWSWRRIIMGRVHCPVMAQEFADACGSDAGEVFLTLCTFLKALAFASRRQLAIRAPDPFGVTPDERQILTLLAAAQSDDHALFQAHLSWLAPPERRRELRVATCALASAFKANDLVLAPPPTIPPGCREPPHAIA